MCSHLFFFIFSEFSDLKLQSQESSYFLLRADRISEKTVSMSDVSLCDKEIIPGNSQPYYDFYNWHIFDSKPESTENLFNIVLCLRWDVSTDLTKMKSSVEKINLFI